MRILNILPSISLETGGPVTAVLPLCREQARQGCEVVLYTTHWPDVDAATPSDGPNRDQVPFSIKMFPFKRCRWMSNLPHSPELIKTLTANAHQFDLIFIHSLWNPLATFSMRALRRAGSRYCLMPHGMLDPVVIKRNRWKKLPWTLLWERSNVEAASIIIFNTPTEEEKARLSGWRLPEVFVLPHAVDLDTWKHLPPSSVFENLFPQVRGAEVILFVGRMSWVKNVDKLIDALALVRRQRASAMLVCVGPDSEGYRTHLEQQIRSLGLEGSVLFTGMLQGDQLRLAYARGNVLALVSQKENFGLTVAEALASGLPVVVSKGVDLARDWSSEGPIRRVSPNPENISEALIELLDRSSTHGLPDPAACRLAEKEFSKMNLSELLDRWKSLRN